MITKFSKNSPRNREQLAGRHDVIGGIDHNMISRLKSHRIIFTEC